MIIFSRVCIYLFPTLKILFYATSAQNKSVRLNNASRLTQDVTTSYIRQFVFCQNVGEVVWKEDFELGHSFSIFNHKLILLISKINKINLALTPALFFIFFTLLRIRHNL